MEEEPVLLAQVVSSPGSRLHFSWGLGNEIYCCDIASDAHEESTSSCVQWCAFINRENNQIRLYNLFDHI